MPSVPIVASYYNQPLCGRATPILTPSEQARCSKYSCQRVCRLFYKAAWPDSSLPFWPFLNDPATSSQMPVTYECTIHTVVSFLACPLCISLTVGAPPWDT